MTINTRTNYVRIQELLLRQGQKAFCKVCHDAGKTQAEYTSHFVKADDRRTVVCPILLSLKCRYCDKAGHTLAYCHTLAKNQKAQERTQKRIHYKPKSVVAKAQKKVSNRFDLLDSDSEAEPGGVKR